MNEELIRERCIEVGVPEEFINSKSSNIAFTRFINESIDYLEESDENGMDSIIDYHKKNPDMKGIMNKNNKIGGEDELSRHY